MVPYLTVSKDIAKDFSDTSKAVERALKHEKLNEMRKNAKLWNSMSKEQQNEVIGEIRDKLDELKGLDVKEKTFINSIPKNQDGYVFTDEDLNKINKELSEFGLENSSPLEVVKGLDNVINSSTNDIETDKKISKLINGSKMSNEQKESAYNVVNAIHNTWNENDIESINRDAPNFNQYDGLATLVSDKYTSAEMDRAAEMINDGKTFEQVNSVYYEATFANMSSLTEEQVVELDKLISEGISPSELKEHINELNLERMNEIHKDLEQDETLTEEQAKIYNDPNKDYTLEQRQVLHDTMEAGVQAQTVEKYMADQKISAESMKVIGEAAMNDMNKDGLDFLSKCEKKFGMSAETLDKAKEALESGVSAKDMKQFSPKKFDENQLNVIYTNMKDLPLQTVVKFANPSMSSDEMDKKMNGDKERTSTKAKDTTQQQFNKSIKERLDKNRAKIAEKDASKAKTQVKTHVKGQELAS